MRKTNSTRILTALSSVVMCAAGGPSQVADGPTLLDRYDSNGGEKSKAKPVADAAKVRPKTRRTQHTRGRPSKDAKLEKMSKEQIEFAIQENETSSLNLNNEERRKLSDSYGYYPTFDNGAEVDSWAQAYRLLGGYIDCDHNKNDQYGASGSNDHRNLGSGNNNDAGYGCSRWLMWAAYYNPNYQGNGYYEYFDEYYQSSSLDCDSSSSEWELIGVYREELYQWYEQISKHLWAIDDYDYVVALAGLSYMTDSDCAQVGNDGYGNAIYAGVQPVSRGDIEMALYSDEYCIQLADTDSTYSDFVGTTNMQLSSQDNGNYYDDLYDYWVDSQEYSLYNFNQVYEPFKSCTPCMDYPTYQDGYFIGDSGTDDDDMINQCWKFYSHDSYSCNGDCIALGSAQGSILEIKYNGYTFGSGSATDTSGTDYSAEEAVEEAKVEVPFLQSEQFATLKANFYIGLASVLFLGTFLAFAVARGSARAIEKEDKAHVLLDDYYNDPYSEKKKRRRDRKSRSGRSPEKSRSSRSASRSGRSRSRATSKDLNSSRSKSSSKRRPSSSRTGSNRSLGSEDSEARRQRRRERRRERERKYEAPDSTESGNNRRSKSRSSRRVRDDF